MGRIKGWEKLGKNEWYNIGFSSKSQGRYIRVKYERPFVWHVQIMDTGGSAFQTIKRPTSRKDALSYVMSYMRQHPGRS